MAQLEDLIKEIADPRLRSQIGSSAIRPSEKLETSLRELLYLVLSAPEYQLG